MTTTEANIILARYMGWERGGKFWVPNVFGEDRGETTFTPDQMQFDKDWNWFQLAFQKARGEDLLANWSQVSNLLDHFRYNEIKWATIELAKLIKTNQTAPSVSGE